MMKEGGEGGAARRGTTREGRIHTLDCFAFPTSRVVAPCRFAHSRRRGLPRPCPSTSSSSSASAPSTPSPAKLTPRRRPPRTAAPASPSAWPTGARNDVSTTHARADASKVIAPGRSALSCAAGEGASV